MKFTLAVGALVLAMLADPVSAGCGSDRWNVAVDQSTGTVRPRTLEVCRGDEVTWTSRGAAGFDVQFAGGSAPGKAERRGTWLVVVIDAPAGKYPYSVVLGSKRVESSIIIK